MMCSEKKSRWTEVKCDYEEDGFWRVDAWKTDDDDEPLEVIAFIDDLTGRVLYNDTLAIYDQKAQAVIQEKLKTLTTLEFKKGAGSISVSMPTDNGSLVAEFEPKEMTGAEEDSVYLCFRNKGSGIIDLDLQAAKLREDRITLYEWDDIHSEDWTRDRVLYMDDIKAETAE